MSKIYTKTGDGGDTSLFDGSRVSKLHPRIASFCAVDEVNAWVGMARSSKPGARIEKMLEQIQKDLFVLGSNLATPKDRANRAVPKIQETNVRFLERTIDACMDKLPPMKHFILPTGCALAATLHVGRTVARRAERAILELNQSEKLPAVILEYTNRLSDALFAIARLANFEAGVKDAPWISDETK